jgi:protein MpaA
MTHRFALALASVVLVSAGAVAGCSELSSSAAIDTVVTTAPDTAPPTTVPDTTVPPTTVPDTTVPPTTVPPTTPVATAGVETRQIGTSVGGRPITAVRRGEVGGRVVLVIGVIHGDEAAGALIVDRLGQLDVPMGVDLWLVPSMNPDGQADVDRHNANQVDLNRNFPYKWGPIGSPGDGQYAGTGPASEPETQAMVAFIDEIRPDLVIWYHQDLFRIAPGTGRDGAIRARYAELVGLPVVSITGGTYTGVAATWARREIEPGVAFIVELGPTLSADEADVHARAVLTVASEAN